MWELISFRVLLSSVTNVQSIFCVLFEINFFIYGQFKIALAVYFNLLLISGSKHYFNAIYIGHEHSYQTFTGKEWSESWILEIVTLWNSLFWTENLIYIKYGFHICVHNILNILILKTCIEKVSGVSLIDDYLLNKQFILLKLVKLFIVYHKYCENGWREAFSV